MRPSEKILATPLSVIRQNQGILSCFIQLQLVTSFQQYCNSRNVITCNLLLVFIVIFVEIIRGHVTVPLIAFSVVVFETSCLTL